MEASSECKSSPIPAEKDHLLTRLQAADEPHNNTEKSFVFLQSVINILLSAVEKYDSRFSFQLVDSSSFFSVKGNEHFELLIFINSKNFNPRDIQLQEQGLPKGITLVRILESTFTHGLWKGLCRKARDGSELLSSKLLRSELSKCLCNLLTDMAYLKHRQNPAIEGIQITDISTDNVVSLKIKSRRSSLIVDLLPSFDWEGLWPDCCISDLKRGETPNFEEKNVESKRKAMNCGIQLISKAGQIEHHWRIWFCKAERFELNFHKFPVRKQCLQLVKTFFISELAGTFLSPYHFQTLLLHESAKFPDKDQWVVEKLSDRFWGLVKALESRVREGFFPHFFIPSLNLFQEVDSDVLRAFAIVQRLHAKSLLENGHAVTSSDKDVSFPVEEENTWL